MLRLLVYLRGLEFRVTCATDTLGVRHASKTTKRICYVRRRRARASFEIVALCVAL